MHINIFWLLIILMMLERTTQYREQYKRKRPYKIGPPRYSRPKPYYRPRWHPSPRKRYKPPARYSYYNTHGPQYSSLHRSPSSYYMENDFIDEQSQHQPYVIEIELPKKYGKQNNRYLDRHYDRNVLYDEDYSEDDEDYVPKFGHRRFKLRGNNKGTSPKLRIKISRVDHKDESEELNSQELMNSMLTLQGTRVAPTEHEVSSEIDWFSSQQPQIFPTVENNLATSPIFDFRQTHFE
ncbi:uncharacterized protein LOC122501991 [Leptopilina heterotoma]|uniref:uncharacterized protein LOC122501991 n=1 Tax=Leptopilina heterotoma TaxID=63436 RepID=UPI001CA8DFEF|nr:uncharacterized protein LOC122501991 [Leptopilina heterotoma]